MLLRGQERWQRNPGFDNIDIVGESYSEMAYIEYVFCSIALKKWIPHYGHFLWEGERERKRKKFFYILYISLYF